MEQKWREARNREVREKRSNEEMVQILTNWSLAKGRIEKEINRKMDSSLNGSKYAELDYRYQKKSEEELRAFDRATKEAALKSNAYQEILQADEEEQQLKIF